AGWGAGRPSRWLSGLPAGRFTRRDPIRGGALKRRAPVISPFGGFVEAGGLVSYGPNYYAAFRRSTVFVDKILRGAKPADLPIEQPTHLDLVVNIKAAEEIWLVVPPLILASADKVITYDGEGSSRCTSDRRPRGRCFTARSAIPSRWTFEIRPQLPPGLLAIADEVTE